MLAILVLNCSLKGQTREVVFWRWFQANESKLFDFESDREVIFNDLNAQPRSVNPKLTFEFGPKEHGKREFVISADGIKEAFPAVVALGDAAPPMPRWRITKFRPRSESLLTVDFDGVQLSPNQVTFTANRRNGKVDLVLYIEGYKPIEREKYAPLVFLMLDECLGEYDVEMKVGAIDYRIPQMSVIGLANSVVFA